MSTVSTAYDVAAVRADLPALAAGAAHFDGPGGSQVPRQVAEAVAATLTSPIANRGQVTAAERAADAIVLAARAAVADLVGGDPARNAQAVRDVLAGAPGPVRDIVLLNAAAALVAEAKPDPENLTAAFGDQLERARTAVDSGAAEAKLQSWVEATQAVR